MLIFPPKPEPKTASLSEKTNILAVPFTPIDMFPLTTGILTLLVPLLIDAPPPPPPAAQVKFPAPSVCKK